MTARFHAFFIALGLIVIATVSHCASADDYVGPYDTTVLRVVDGDTFVARIRTWPGATKETGDYKVIKVRISGANTPELRTGPACERALGEIARAKLESLLQAPVQVWITDIDKYADRIDAVVIANGINIAQALIDSGVAKPYHGEAREAWCSGN